MSQVIDDASRVFLPGLVPDALAATVDVVEHEAMARDTFRLRLRCPELARRIVPGQFFMVRAPGRDDPLLGRPFALYDVYDEDGVPAGVDFGYIVVGKLTTLMSGWTAGESVEVWGPLGNGFPPPPTDGHLMLVAGGIGQTPFLAVAREALGLRRYGEEPEASAPGAVPRIIEHRPRRVTLCYGARSRDYLAGLDDFRMEGLEVRLSTDDGTAGRHGFVTALLVEAIEGGDRPDAVYCCGPEPMMHAVQQICQKHAIPCWLSLESPMACGFGACFSCVTRVREGDGPDDWDYRRTCVEGPVFPAEKLVF
ncbi:MAG: dihydroorotate dehydrogenase electron transfer subunit [Planctomycetes bacterium]|nr:dihydroorotate dehydrogenase electron transfer subunit [Planctomycetota bacterium]